MALGIFCFRGKARGFKFQAPRFPSFPFASFSPPQLPSRARNAPIIRTLFPSASVGLVPERPEDRGFQAPMTEKTKGLEAVHEAVSEKSISPQMGEQEDDAPLIDPGFMREISLFMDKSPSHPGHQKSPNRSVYQHSHQPSGTLSMAGSTYSRNSNGLPASSRSNSTIILPGSFTTHSRNASEGDSMFAPTRLNSAVGPWRDSLWSTTATPTGMLPPSSAFASQRQSRRSLSLSARAAMARDTGSWTEDVSRRSSGLFPQSMILPPLPTSGVGRSSLDQSSRPSEQGKAQSSKKAPGFFGSPWPLR